MWLSFGAGGGRLISKKRLIGVSEINRCLPFKKGEIMNILMTGGTGLLGEYMIRERPKNVSLTMTQMDVDTYSYYHGYPKAKKYKKLEIQRIDAGSLHAMDCLFKNLRPDVVIHAASFSSPDEVERNPSQFMENVHMTHNVAMLCKKYKSRMIFISSNAVYRGNQNAYAEWDQRLPVNSYGLSKLLGETITESLDNGTTVRLTMMYGNLNIFTKARSNLALQIIENVKNKKHMWLFSDIMCKPLYAGQAAKAIYAVLDTAPLRLSSFNISGNDTVSMYDFGIHVCASYRLDSKFIHPVKEEAMRLHPKAQSLRGMNITAIRPQNTSFRSIRMESILGIKPLTVYTGLTIMRSESK